MVGTAARWRASRTGAGGRSARAGSSRPPPPTTPVQVWAAHQDAASLGECLFFDFLEEDERRRVDFTRDGQPDEIAHLGITHLLLDQSCGFFAIAGRLEQLAAWVAQHSSRALPAAICWQSSGPLGAGGTGERTQQAGRTDEGGPEEPRNRDCRTTRHTDFRMDGDGGGGGRSRLDRVPLRIVRQYRKPNHTCIPPW